jgi:hypothetical protein
MNNTDKLLSILKEVFGIDNKNIKSVELVMDISRLHLLKIELYPKDEKDNE